MTTHVAGVELLEQFSRALTTLTEQHVQPNGLTNAGSATNLHVNLRWNQHPRSAARAWVARVVHIDRSGHRRVWQTRMPTPAQAILRLTIKLLETQT